MKLNEYQDQAWSTALPECQNPNYMLLGLLNETGEIAGAVKKFLRGDISALELQNRIKKEAGDALWYLSGFLKSQDIYLEDVGQENVAKLADRKARGVLKGDGDNR
jgi:NTP pyrophosphatase (non-canonical NTP hydrolase)